MTFSSNNNSIINRFVAKYNDIKSSVEPIINPVINTVRELHVPFNSQDPLSQNIYKGAGLVGLYGVIALTVGVALKVLGFTLSAIGSVLVLPVVWYLAAAGCAVFVGVKIYRERGKIKAIVINFVSPPQKPSPINSINTQPAK